MPYGDRQFQYQRRTVGPELSEEWSSVPDIATWAPIGANVVVTAALLIAGTTLASVEVTGKGNVPLDRWEPHVSQPVQVPEPLVPEGFSVKDPTPIAPAEEVTSDKWHPLYPEQPGRGPQPLVAEGWTVVDANLLTQAETAQLDKWLSHYPDQLLPRHQTRPGIEVTDVGAPELPIYAWRPTYPDQLLPEHQTRPGWSVIDPQQLTEAEATLLPKWEPSYPDFARGATPLVAEGDYEIDAQLLTEHETVRPDKWLPTYPDLLLPQHLTRPGLSVIDANLPTTHETTFVDKWLPKHPDILLPAAPLVAEGAFEIDSDFLTQAPDVHIGFWHPCYADQILVPEPLVAEGYIVVDASQLTQGETIEVDKWLSRYPDLLLPAPPREPGWTVIDADALATANEGTVPDQWYPIGANVTIEGAYLSAGALVTGGRTSGNAEVTLDRWTARYPDLLLPEHLTRTGWYTIDATQLLAEEATLLSKWLPTYPDILLPAPPREPGWYVVDADLLTTPNPPPPPDQWYPQYNAVIALEYLHPGVTIVGVLKQEEATIDKWIGEWPDFARGRQQLVAEGLVVVDPQWDAPEQELFREWAPTYPDLHLVGPQPLVAEGTFVTDVGVAEVPVAQWRPDYPDLLLPQHQTGEGWIVIDAQQLTEHETITVDKWWQPASEPYPAVLYPVAEGWYTADAQLFEVPAALDSTPIGEPFVGEIQQMSDGGIMDTSMGQGS